MMRALPRRLEVRPIGNDAAAVALAPAMRHNPFGGIESMADVLHGAQCFELSDQGDPFMTYGLRVIERARGVEVVIAAAAGRLPGVDLTSTALAVIEEQTQHYDVLSIVTARPGLVKKLLRHGFHAVALVLAKSPRVKS